MSTFVVPFKIAGRTHHARFAREGSVVSASVDVNTPFGMVTVSAHTDETTIRRAVAAALQSKVARRARELAMEYPEALETFFGEASPSTHKAARKLAHNRVLSGLVSGVRQVAGGGHADKARAILARARAGDPRAINALKAVSLRARLGDARARRALKVIQAVQGKGATKDLLDLGGRIGELFMPGFADSRRYARMRDAIDMVAGDDGAYRVRVAPRYRYGLPCP